MTTNTARTEDILNDNLMQQLPVKLTDAALVEISRQHSKLLLFIDETEKEAKREKKKWDDRIADLDENLRAMAKVLKAGEEQRPVACYVRLNGSNVETIRKDTNEVVLERPANLSELQRNLPIGAVAESDGGKDEDAEQRDAAQVQKDANVEEDDDGDIIPIAGDEKKRKARRK